jgi:hypothetical protein
MRIGLFTSVFTTVLAGLGAGYLILRRPDSRKWRISWTVLLIGLVLFDFFPRSIASNLGVVEHRAVDEWLAEQPGDGAVVQFPFSESEDQSQIYYTSIYDKPFVGGFFNANQPPQYQAIKPVLDSFPSDESVQTLRDLNVTYIVVDTHAYEDYTAVEAEILARGLVKLADIDGQSVYGFANP